ncbi:hypothetical protein KIH74_33745 [Kineosporia sp. J2-2]|uniref:Uncharacterized protein n=1 Tax=Kineosporia corallincola TaxID=2835133 RepID=A0ABS5TT40_9ACTN|nr:hypothetical protein [Kineosporia corallincola]MBT0773957.1 hypothetical protein [Kineosporia corallincola]
MRHGEQELPASDAVTPRSPGHGLDVANAHRGGARTNLVVGALDEQELTDQGQAQVAEGEAVRFGAARETSVERQGQVEVVDINPGEHAEDQGIRHAGSAARGPTVFLTGLVGILAPYL